MQNATWLMSRELADAIGPWNEQLQYDQDGEYYARAVAASEGIRFVPEGRIYYRLSGSNRISYIGKSDVKKNSLLVSMSLHIRYLRSLEESERVRKACLTYLQNWYYNFYPDRPDLVEMVHDLAVELQGRLEPPRIHWKYAWMGCVFGKQAARWAQRVLPETKCKWMRQWDKAIFDIERLTAVASHSTEAVGATQKD
jgi:hypothetical protein